MSKSELIAKVAEELGATKKLTGEVINQTITTIMETVVGGEEVNLMGFAAFKTTPVGERNGVNPLTGDKIVIPAHNKLTIKASGAFKDAVKKNS